MTTTTTYPLDYDALENPDPTSPLASSTVPHSQQHRDLNDIIEALERKVGIGDSAPGIDPGVLRRTGVGVSTWGQIQSSDIAAAAIIGGHVAPAQISGAASGVSGHILPATITGANIQDASIPPSKLTETSVGSAQIQPDSINSSHIAPNAIQASDIAPAQINGGHIQANAVNAGHIGANQIYSAHIVDGTIAYADIGAGQIGTIHLGPGIINNSHIANRTILPEDIAPGAVTSYEIADRTILGTDIGVNQVGTTELAAQAVSYGAQGSSSAAFSVTNNTSWVFDNANLVISQEMYAGGFVRVIFQGSFQSSVAGTAARFGIIRYGIDGSPAYPLLVHFPEANQAVPVTVVYQGYVALGTYFFTLGMQCVSTGYTLAWTPDGSRFMSSLGFWR